MLDRMSSNDRAIRRSVVALLAVALTLLVGACAINSTTPAPRSTIIFIVRNTTHTTRSFKFTGSATVADVTGRLACGETTIGTTWDPSWAFGVGDPKGGDTKVIGSTDSPELRVASGTAQALTVIIVIDSSGARAIDHHPGAPAAGDAATLDPAICPTPSPSA